MKAKQKKASNRVSNQASNRVRELNISTFQSLIFGLAQHVAAALFCVLLASIIFNSYLSVYTMNGEKNYYLDPFTTSEGFEDSEVFGKLFQTSVNDVIRLVIMRDQMEAGGAFWDDKPVDVTDFACRYGSGEQSDTTAVFRLEDLIKWGRFGLEYKMRVMSLSDFVNYYGDACAAENFGLDGNDNLYFRGYYKSGKPPAYKTEDELNHLTEVMSQYSREQLEDMAFSYILGQVGEGISMSREDDGNFSVHINTLTCRYATIDKKTQLFELARDWGDFLKLQKNVAETATVLSQNYDLYQQCYGLYEESHSNLKYVVRMRDRNGQIRTFTNVSGCSAMEDNDLTEHFEEYRRFLIYYPNSLEFMGNTLLTEADIYESLRMARYPYPEEVHLWIGLDTTYACEGDAFYQANGFFAEFVPYINAILVFLFVLGLLWMSLVIYLTVTTGTASLQDGTTEYRLFGFDRIWSEILVLLCVGGGYAAFRGFSFLRDVANQYYSLGMSPVEGTGADRLYHYGCYAAYGFLVSMFFSILWFSFIRRIKAGNLFRDSFVHFVFRGITKAMESILSHRNSVISVVLPYSIFLLLNLIAAVATLQLDNLWGKAVIVFVAVITDLVVGLMLFQNNAEHNDIVDGINRIRSGEVEFKLDSTAFHGENRLLADAVNNIGEGIDNAVKTSIKDERLKTDLITNVSHDIKTPLTSIINYVTLLKRQNIQTEPARGYIEILESKSLRLKELTDDLVEASKISSGNIVLNLQPLNLGELLMQTVGEFSEKLEDRSLSVVTEVPPRPACIYADSRRMWRVMENLFHNICKYAMEGTRVYAEILIVEDRVQLSIKNISSVQMNIHAEELTERFIRGDSARSTEGSGLGLFIAKSLTNAQGGNFEIQLDGDLFKIILTFPMYQEEGRVETPNREQ